MHGPGVGSGSYSLALEASLAWEEAVKSVLTGVCFIAGLLTAGTVLAQDLKSQATAQRDAAFDAADAAKLSKAYARDAVILPAGSEQAIGLEGAATLSGGSIKDGVKYLGASPSLSGTSMRSAPGRCFGA
jgi:hypothetical protein